MLTSSWVAEYVASEIRQGDLSDTLVRPVPYVMHYITNNNRRKKQLSCRSCSPILPADRVCLPRRLTTAGLILWRLLSFLICLPLAGRHGLSIGLYGRFTGFLDCRCERAHGVR